MHFANRIIDAITTPSNTFNNNNNNNNNYSNNYNNNILLPTLEERLQAPPSGLPSTLATALTPLLHTPPNATVVSSSGGGGGDGVNSSSISTIGQIASIVVSNFRSPPTTTAQLPATTTTATSTIIIDNHLTGNALNNTIAPTHSQHYQQTSYYPTFNPPAIESLVASSAEQFGNNFHDLSFDVFDDNDNNLFGSPLSFDASENGLWNGRFVPPPPRPPFFVDETILSDGLTTCDLCSWAIPTKSTFIFESSMEKASELGWPLTLTIVSILSALLGAIIMITVVKCRRKKSSQQRTGKCFRNFNINKIQQQQPQQHPITMSNLEQNNHDMGTRLETQQLESFQANGISRKFIQQQQQQQQHTTINNLQERYTHVQWWSRNKRPNGNNNHLRRSNIYTAHPADSIRGLQTNALPATATVVGMLGDAVPLSLSAAVTQMSLYHSSSLQQQLQQQHEQQQQQSETQHQLEHEYHQPQDLQQQMTLKQQQTQQQQQQQQHCHVAQHHQHEHSSSSISSSSTTTSSPSLLSNVIEQQQQQQPQKAQQQVQCRLHKPLQITKQILLTENVQMQPVEQQHQLQQLQYQKQQQHQQQLLLQQSSASELHDNLFHWPTATTLVTS